MTSADCNICGRCTACKRGRKLALAVVAELERLRSGMDYVKAAIAVAKGPTETIYFDRDRDIPAVRR